MTVPMSEDHFERLLYTDCLAGHGRGSGAGFQVQAQSDGVESSQVADAVRWLLYEPPDVWLNDGRPIDEFPAALAHCAEHGYATSQSVYLGKEVKGPRFGNYLSDCILARASSAYGAVRPAQLWRAEHWRSSTWPTTTCPRLDESPESGPLTIDAVAAWLRDDPARETPLVRMLTAIERPDGQVMLVASTPDAALTWIAAATLLLPMQDALGLSFKVFCANVSYARHRILGVSREVHPAVRPGRSGSGFVLDADSAECDEVQPSSRASFWVDRLLRCEDPYDVVDAVELAAHLERGHPGPADALATAWALTAPAESTPYLAAAFRWLQSADDDLVGEFGAAVAELLLNSPDDAEVLRWLEHAAAQERIDVDRQRLRTRLALAEINELRAGRRPRREPLVDVYLTAESRRDLTSALSSAVLLADDDQVDGLLVLAKRHNVVLQVSQLLERLRKFVADWASAPRSRYVPGDWALQPEMLDLARDELRGRILQSGADANAGLIAAWLPLLLGDNPDPQDAVDCHLVAALGSDPQRRRRLMRVLVSRAVRCDDSRGALLNVTDALWPSRRINADDAIWLLTAVPRNLAVPQFVTSVATTELANRAKLGLDKKVLDGMKAARHRGAGFGAELDDLVVADGQLEDLIRRFRTDSIARELADRRRLPGLASVPDRILKIRREELTDAILDCNFVAVVRLALDILPEWVTNAVLAQWKQKLRPGVSLGWVEWGFYLASASDSHPKRRATIISHLREFARSLPNDERAAWLTEVQDQLLPEYVAQWQEAMGVRPASGEPAAPRRVAGQEGAGAMADSQQYVLLRSAAQILGLSGAVVGVAIGALIGLACTLRTFFRDPDGLVTATAYRDLRVAKLRNSPDVHVDHAWPSYLIRQALSDLEQTSEYVWTRYFAAARRFRVALFTGRPPNYRWLWVLFPIPIVATVAVVCAAAGIAAFVTLYGAVTLLLVAVAGSVLGLTGFSCAGVRRCGGWRSRPTRRARIRTATASQRGRPTCALTVPSCTPTSGRGGSRADAPLRLRAAAPDRWSYGPPGASRACAEGATARCGGVRPPFATSASRSSVTRRPARPASSSPAWTASCSRPGGAGSTSTSPMRTRAG